MDWSGCELVRSDPRSVSGATALKSEPRVPVEALIDNLEDGLKPERVAKLYDVPLADVVGVYKFYKANLNVSSVR